MRAVAPIAAILLCACGSAGAVSSASPSAGASGSPTTSTPASAPRLESPSPTSQSQSPSPIALLAVTDPGFSCRLPVDATLGESPLKGGWVTVPRGSFLQDASSGLVNVTGQQWSYQTTAQPVLKGTDGLGYDAPRSRWVPAVPEVFSADGSIYAWTERDATANRLHVTTVADGSDRTWSVNSAQQGGPIPVPLALTDGSVLLTYGWEGTFGVWRLDLSSGSLTKLSGEPAPRGYGAGAVWVGALRGSTPVGAEQSDDTLARLDLSTGVVTDWFHRDATLVRYLGVDVSGSPWVDTAIYTPPQTWSYGIWRVRGPGQADAILAGQEIDRIISDSHGTWFGNTSGVYLFAGGNLERVSAGSVGEVIGPCVG